MIIWFAHCTSNTVFQTLQYFWLLTTSVGIQTTIPVGREAVHSQQLTAAKLFQVTTIQWENVRAILLQK